MTTAQIAIPDQQVDFMPGFGEEQYSQLGVQDEPELLRAKREEAFRFYKNLPVPTNRTEEWRRTGPALFPFDSLKSLPQLKQAEYAGEGSWDKYFDVVVSIDDTSFSIHDRSGVLKKEVVFVLPLAEASIRFPDLVKKHLQGQALPADMGKIEALNSAFWNIGLFIYIPAKTDLKKGILIKHQHQTSGAILVPRLVAVVEEQSTAHITEHFLSVDDLSFMSITSKELYVQQAARLKIVTLKKWGNQSYHVASDMARVEKDAQVDLVTFNTGGKVSKMKFGSDVAGKNSAAELDGLFFGQDDQHFDQTTLQVHSSPDTYSRLLYKGVVKDKAHSVYQGVIQAKPGAIRVDAYQTNNNIVLNDGARADTIPGLLIDADDLKCSHGATIGNLDEEQIFYLRSRGLSESEARRIVLIGFFEEVIERIPQDFIRDHIHELINQKILKEAED
ncbi:MAG: Fe-S cluster assembly protein SufD [Kiritimatiellae bacterium]|nr:Fe-S cluster assembly protein SufD [Kiritimatiellia bacterium]